MDVREYKKYHLLFYGHQMLAVHVAGGDKSHVVCLETQAANVVTASRSIDGKNIIYYYG